MWQKAKTGLVLIFAVSCFACLALGQWCISFMYSWSQPTMCHYTREALKAQVEWGGPENRAVPDLLLDISHSELATKKLASSSKYLKNPNIYLFIFVLLFIFFLIQLTVVVPSRFHHKVLKTSHNQSIWVFIRLTIIFRTISFGLDWRKMYLVTLQHVTCVNQTKKRSPIPGIEMLLSRLVNGLRRRPGKGKVWERAAQKNFS